MVCDMADVKKSDINEFTETSALSLSSCLRSMKSLPKQQLSSRSVSFPEDDSRIVTGYLDPPNPWEFAECASKEKVLSKYVESCERHRTPPIQSVLQQLQEYEVNGERAECLNLKGETLTSAACEALEEVLKRIQLVTIDVSNSSLDDEAAVVMFDMIEYYEAASNVLMRDNSGIGARGWQACSRMLKRSSSVECLDASSTQLTEQCMTILCRALRLANHLQVLKLNNTQLSGRPIVSLVAALKMNKCLKELHLGENSLDSHDALQLGALLKHNSKLQLLDLSNNCFEDVGAGHLCDGLIEQDPTPGLTMLVLWNNKLTTASAKIFSKTLLCVASLEVLNIGCNCLGDESISTMKEGIADSRTLLRLGIQSTGISDSGATILADILSNNTSLQRLDIRDNNILVEGLTQLVSSLKNNKSLTRLDIDPPRLKTLLQGNDLDKYAELWDELRVECRENESEERENEILERARNLSLGSSVSRKISLTCNTLHLDRSTPHCSPLLDVTLLKAGGRGSASGRLRSPAPSPIPSPVASPSPTRTRFQVSRVSEDTSTVPTIVAPVSSPSGSGGSRFRVTVVEPSSAAALPSATSSATDGGSGESASMLPSAASPSAPIPTSGEKKMAGSSDDGVVSRAGRKLQSWVTPSLLSENRAVEKLLGLLPWGRSAASSDLINNNTSSSGATWPPHQAPTPSPSPPSTTSAPSQHSASTPSLVS